MSRRATAADVASRAGVSRATVSYVLNGTANQTISPRTTAAVLKAAEELGYRPNPFAQSLKRGRGGTVLLPLPEAPHVMVLAAGIDACAAALAEHGLTLVTDVTQYPSAASRIDAWMRLHPAAVIDLFLPAGDPAVVPLREAGVAVLTSTAAPVGDASAADMIAYEARKTQLNYLLERGHRRVVIAGPSAPIPAHERVRRSWAAAAGKAVGATVTARRADLSRRGVDAIADGWRSGAQQPDAVAAFNDDFAVALLSAFAVRGIRVPQDVAVIGVDDIPLAAACTPTLTTVTSDVAAWGRAIAGRVCDALEGSSDVVPVPLFDTSVVVRESA
ncbi:MAG: LacI family DNA-binding transcriptional regulator [Actinobacteria bacterium]|nr:LacI family DNA-binding transcriptional regulator [Actinomycetota bacterium]MBV8959364.1 LacI family DNA-binding transcriptional regulator [Actinomycetota bacterium]